ncbi:MAG: PAS domain S-box protein, partial [Gammaproteobacteria bacterium]|nr:PAS domain S-box protein [Gammaproteobacteria bacterium]
MNEPDSAVYREILENLLDGVLVVGFDGTVRTLNDAACRILGLRRDGTVGRTFGEIFVETEGFDEFTQIVLDAALSRSSMERHVTDVRIDGRTRSLAVSISYLDAARGGDRAGVIAVITDMTEIREFRENELRLAKEIEAQHGKLRKAYGEIESRNAMLSQMLKKIQVARGMATFLVIGLFMVVGIRYLQPLGDFGLGPVHSLIDSVASAGGPDIAAGGPAPLPTLVVEPRRFSSTISLRGNLAPGKIVEVVSPIESHVVAVHARIGDPVEKGDRLVGLDTGKIVAEHRQAQVDHIRKLDALADLEEWESGTEYAGAERRFRRARISLGNARTLLERTALLLEQGIIPASEHEQASQNHESRLLDYDAAVQELEATRAKGGEDAKRIAALEGETARARPPQLGDTLAHDVVHG